MSDILGVEQTPPLSAFAHQFMCHAGTIIITSQVAYQTQSQAFYPLQDPRIAPWLRLFEGEPQPSAFGPDGLETDTALLGVGPINAMVGDEVWVLAGARTPVVLRPSASGRHQLLGEAYVHGAMHGQALDCGLPLQDITLE